jgi:cold shock protein
VQPPDQPESLSQGQVKWFDPKKGYGFIVNRAGEDVFVHFSMIEGDGFRALRSGERVKFAIRRSSKGLSAVRVRRVGMPRPPTIVNKAPAEGRQNGDETSALA